MGETSANTETIICQLDCDNNLQIIAPPHPGYSNTTGGTVVQMNAVTIGGNGLNA